MSAYRAGVQARLAKAVVIAVGTSAIVGLGVGLAVTSGASPAPDRAPIRIAPVAGELPAADSTAPDATTPDPTTTVTTAAASTQAAATPATTTTSVATPTTARVPTTVAPSPTADAEDGSLSATLSASAGAVVGSPVSFVVSVTDTAATGPVGPTNLSYGDGQPEPETGLAASCHARAPETPVDESFDYTHTYVASGTYSVAVTVSAPCSAQQVVVELPVTVVD